MVPEPYENFTKSRKVNLSLDNIIEAAPFITFLYLFQPNVPATYLELRTDASELSTKEKLAMMDKVLYRSAIYSNLLYVVVGINGYLIFASSEMETME
jgi:amino acid permease